MEIIVNNLIKAIGWSILHSLWQGAIIYATLFLALVLFPKLNSKVKHNLAFGSLLLLFTIFCCTFFSLFKLPVYDTTTQQLLISKITHPDIYQLRNSFSFNTEVYLPVIVTVYMLGIFFQLLVFVSSYLKLQHIKGKGTLAIPRAWKILFDKTVSHLNINKEVKFFLSEKVNVPLIIGFFKPVVLFPVSLATQLDMQQVEAILIHELSHIRRNDYLINLVKTGIETLLFFNPFVWLISKFIAIEREYACDDLVVNFTGTPLTYAHALLKLELVREKNTPALSLAATGNNQHLYQRIKRITNMKTNYINAKQQFLILTLTIATVASLAWINPTKQTHISKRTDSKKTIKITTVTDKPLDKHIVLRADTDTTKVKCKKIKIIITDASGNQNAYNSISEMPDSLRAMAIRNVVVGDSISNYYSSPEWKSKIDEIQKQALEVSKKFESKEWKDQMAEVQKSAVAMSKKFETKEWKDQMAKIQKNALAISKQFDSKEWKDQMAKVQANAMAIAKQFQSKEWKENMQKLQKNVEETQKKLDHTEPNTKIEDLKNVQ